MSDPEVDPDQISDSRKSLEERVRRLELIVERTYSFDHQLRSLSLLIQDLSSNLVNLRLIASDLGRGDSIRLPVTQNHGHAANTVNHRSLIKGHYLEIVIGMLIGLFAVAITLYLFTRSR